MRAAGVMGREALWRTFENELDVTNIDWGGSHEGVSRVFVFFS